MVPKVFQVPGVPAVTHTQPIVPPAEGVESQEISPTAHVPVAGATVGVVVLALSQLLFEEFVSPMRWR